MVFQTTNMIAITTISYVNNSENSIDNDYIIEMITKTLTIPIFITKENIVT